MTNFPLFKATCKTTFKATVAAVWLVSLAFGVAFVAPSARAEEGLQLSFLGEGRASLSFRYRIEAVDQDGFDKNAHASTLRTRLNYATKKENTVQLVLEADNVLRLGGSTYSDGNRTVPGYPVVADPVGTEINQAFVRVKAADEADFAIGRQRINYDDQRFIGGVGWRQNEQTYDAARIMIKLTDNTRIEYGYLWNVNRVFGPESGAQASDWSCECHVLNLAAKPWKDTNLAVFAYELDIKDAPAQANRTLGFRLAGKNRTSDGNYELSYLFSYASQRDAGRNSVDYRADYFHGRLQIARDNVKAKAGFESLGGDSANAGSQFVTPLATLHAFNGWTDKFLSTPDAGLQDVYFGVDFPVASASASLVWHDFSAEDGSDDYGTELGLAISKKLKEGLSVLGKLARYSSDGFASDTTKYWLMLSYAP